MNGVVEQASEEELADAAARADRTGMYTCPHTAVALAVAREARASAGIDRSGRARRRASRPRAALKFTEFKVRYHERQLEGIARRAREPAGRAAADYGKVVDAIEKHFA